MQGSVDCIGLVPDIDRCYKCSMRSLVAFLLLALPIAAFQVVIGSPTNPGPDGIYRVGGGVSPPMPIYKPEPKYPEDARARNVEGEVLLTVVIDAKGVPGSVSVTRSLDPSLDQEAILTAQQWRFKPGMKDGNPISVRATIAMTFRLHPNKE